MKNNNFFITTLLLAIVLPKCFSSLPFWPLPSSVDLSGTIKQAIDGGFKFTANNNNPLVKRAIDRYMTLLNIPLSSTGNLKSCSISISDTSTSIPIIGADESYSLNISEDGQKCTVDDANQWGVLHALVTFSQSCTREASGDVNTVIMNNLPLFIVDKARFIHRGLLIDTSRHYQSVGEIKRIIDSLPISKCVNLNKFTSSTKIELLITNEY